MGRRVARSPAESSVSGAGPRGCPQRAAPPGTGLARCGRGGGRSAAGGPRPAPRVAGARQEGAPAALPALGRDKGRSPGPSPAAAAAAAARAARVRAAGPAPGATPAPRPPPPAFSAPEVARAPAGAAGDLQAPASPPPARPAPARSAAAEEAETAGRRRPGERGAAGPGPWRPRSARCCRCCCCCSRCRRRRPSRAPRTPPAPTRTATPSTGTAATPGERGRARGGGAGGPGRPPPRPGLRAPSSGRPPRAPPREWGRRVPREPPGSSGAPEFGGLPLLVQPPPPPLPGRPAGRPACPERRWPPELGDPLWHPQKLRSPEFLPRTWGSPILGPLRGPPQHRSSWRSPGNLVAELCQVGDHGPQGKWSLGASCCGSPHELGEVNIFLPTSP